MKQFASIEELNTDLRLLRNKEDVFVKHRHYDLFISFPKS